MIDYGTDYPPRQLDQYRLEEQLKEGGEARVYKGTDRTGKVAAIRVLRMQDNTEDVRRRFQREVQNLKKLQGHPHIIPLSGSGLVGKWAYLVMPYIPGGSLADLLKRGRQFSFKEILTFLQQTADALSFAHERGIIHRDVKPDNLLCGPGGLLLSDFGIAYDEKSGDTRTREFHGTEHYRAPEQDRGQSGAASDQYALAVLACYLFTRKYPDELRANALPAELPAKFPQIAAVLDRVLVSDPGQRFPSIKDFANALDRAALATIPAKPEDTVQVPLWPFSVPTQPALPRFSPSVPGRPHFLSHAITSLLTILLTLLMVFFAVRLPWGFLPQAQSGACRLLQPASSQATKPVIKIGVELPLSGSNIHDGQPLLNAIELAVAKSTLQNKIPGYTLEVYACDDVNPGTHTHDGGIGAANIEVMAGDAQVAAIIGPFNSDVAIDELPIANRDDLALISPSTTSTCLTSTSQADLPSNSCLHTTYQKLHPETENGVTFFRTAASDMTEGKKLADYLYGLRYTTAYVLEDTGTYGQDFGEAFKGEWKKISGITPQGQTFDPDHTSPNDYRTALQAFQPADPTHSVIFYAGNTPNATLIYALIEQKTQLRGIAFAAGGGIISSNFVTDIEGSQQSGNIYAITPVGRSNSLDNGDGVDFYSKYLSTYGDQPTPYSASAYDCANIIINAIAAAINSTTPPTGPGDNTGAQTFRKAVIAALQRTSYNNGVTDQYVFNNGSCGDNKPLSYPGDTCNQTVSLYQFDMTSQHWVYIPTTDLA